MSSKQEQSAISWHFSDLAKALVEEYPFDDFIERNFRWLDVLVG